MTKTMKARSIYVRWFTAGLFAMVLSFSPFVVTEKGTIETQIACADGSCCPYNGAICGLNGENYPDKDYNSGPCDDGWNWPWENGHE